MIEYFHIDHKWLEDLRHKCSQFKTYYVAVKIPLDVLEQREKARATSPQGHARSHYFSVYGDKEYDLVVHTDTQSAQEIALQLKALVQ